MTKIREDAIGLWFVSNGTIHRPFLHHNKSNFSAGDSVKVGKRTGSPVTGVGQTGTDLAKGEYDEYWVSTGVHYHKRDSYDQNAQIQMWKDASAQHKNEAFMIRRYYVISKERRA